MSQAQHRTAQDKLAQSDFIHGDNLKDDAKQNIEQEDIQQALVFMQQGNYDSAEFIYKRLIEKGIDKYIVFSNLAIIYYMKNRIDEMIMLLKEALRLNPNHPEVLTNLGVALQKQTDLPGAIELYKKALAIKPDFLNALLNLGNALLEQGELQATVDCYKQALTIDPKSLVALINVGTALAKQRELQAAIDYYKQALTIDPKSLVVLNNLGNASKEQRKLQTAIKYYKQALAIDSKSLETLNSLGIALMEQGKLQTAIDYYRKALAIDSKSLQVLNNLGLALTEQGELQEAIILYRKAIFLKEDYYDTHYNLSPVLLLSGDYENGWREYEWRLHKKLIIYTPPQIKRWDGCNNLSENKLLLRYDGGFGDTLHFMRYIPYLIKRGMNVAFYAQTKLHGLIQASGITKEIYSPEEIYQHTTGEWLPLQSLPKCLNVRPDNPLVSESYIKAPQENILFWKQKLSSENRPIIGICWQGSPQRGLILRNRSFPLQTFALIIETIDASFLSLQKGFGSEQLTDCRFLDRFVGCQEEINQTWDFVENAAIVMNCDLIITVDTAVAHLAAGLGQPTWLLLQKVPEWRWGMEGDTTFWYPSMRLFRQREHGNWSEVMDRVASALQIVFSDMDSPMARS